MASQASCVRMLRMKRRMLSGAARLAPPASYTTCSFLGAQAGVRAMCPQRAGAMSSFLPPKSYSLVLSAPSRIPDIVIDLSRQVGSRRSQQMERGKPSRKIPKKVISYLELTVPLISTPPVQSLPGPKRTALSSDLKKSPLLTNL